MANGDDAAAVGMDTVAGSEDIRLSYDEINKSRDYLAQHRTDGTHSAGQIASGILPVVRGGTGRGALYGTEHEGGPNPSGRRILIVDNENRVFASIGDIAPQYLGFRVHFTLLENVDFDDGQAVEPHGAPFTPTFVMCQGLLVIDGGGSVIVTPRGDLEPANSENVFLRAFVTSTGLPYDSAFDKIMLLCMAVA